MDETVNLVAVWIRGNALVAGQELRLGPKRLGMVWKSARDTWCYALDRDPSYREAQTCETAKASVVALLDSAYLEKFKIPEGWMDANSQLNAMIAASGHTREDSGLILRNLYEAGWALAPRFLTEENSNDE